MKNLINLVKPGVLALAALAFVSAAKADDTLLTLSGLPPVSGGNAGTTEGGLAFTPTETITVTQLGAFAGDAYTASGAPGFDGSTYDAGGVTTQDFTAILYSYTQSSSSMSPGTGTVITDAVIKAGTAVNSDGVAFVTLATPIVLSAGTEYWIGADGGDPGSLDNDEYIQEGSGSNNFADNEDFFNSEPGVTFDTSGFTNVGGSGVDSLDPTAPAGTSPGTSQTFTQANVYLDGDLRYAIGVVPEPSDVAYLAVGAAALAFLLRRRQNG